MGAPALTGNDASEPRHVERDQRSDGAQLRRVVDEQVQPAERARGVDQPPPHGWRPYVARHGVHAVPTAGRERSAAASSAPAIRARRSPGRIREPPAHQRSPAEAAARPGDDRHSFCFTHRATSWYLSDPYPSVHLQVHLKSRRKFATLHPGRCTATIGEVAARSGVATSALRFYEDAGPDSRGAHGCRAPPVSSRAVIRRVAFIVFAQKVGLSLEEIRARAGKLPTNRVPERADWAKLSAAGRSAFRRASRSWSGCSAG